MHWCCFASKTWKLATMQSMLLRASKTSSNTTHRKKFDHIVKSFTNINDYPSNYHVVKKTINMIESSIVYDKRTQEDCNNKQLLILLCKGPQGETIARSLRKTLNQLTSEQTTTQVVYNSYKLISYFGIKDY